MLRFGLTTGSQSRSRGCTPGCYTEIGIQVPYGPGIQNGSQVRDRSCRNKFLAQKWFYTHLSKLTHSNTPPPQFCATQFACATFPQPTTDGRNRNYGYVPRREIWHKKQDIWRGARRLRRIMTGIQSKSRDSNWKKNDGHKHSL